MKNSIVYFIPLLLFLSFLSCKDDDTLTLPPSIDSPSALSAILEDVIDQTEVPGFALSLVKNDQIVYQQAFGYADLENAIPYSNQTVQHIASISKTFVGAATAKAIEQGLFDLESNINDLLPVAIINPKKTDAQIKVKHLVTHTSGLLDNTAVYFPMNYRVLPGSYPDNEAAQVLEGLVIEQRSGVSLEDYLAEYFLPDGNWYDASNFAATAPGSQWAYSNTATTLMAFLIEYTSGQDFADYVQTHILHPLEMDHSSYDSNAVDFDAMAQWYLRKGVPFPRYTNDSYVEGSMYTNNEDLGRYLLDLMRGASKTGGQILSPAAYEMLFNEQLPAGVVPSDFADNHGLFWILKGDKIQHGGNSLGVSTYLEFDKTGKTGYALITNMDASVDYAPYQEVALLIDQAIQKFFQAN